MDKEAWKPALIDDIFQSLKEIEVEEGVPLMDKAFIADYLSFKLEKLSYRKIKDKPPLLSEEYQYRAQRDSDIEWYEGRG